MSTSDDPQFKSWLAARMNAANLSKAERAEFLKWLVGRKNSKSNGTGSDTTKRKRRLEELKECYDWLKVRITDSDISEVERREFDLWMASRVRENKVLDDDE